MSEWNGLPDQPERSGWHVIACGAPRAVWWDAESHYWWDGERRFYITIPEIKASSRSYKYLGAVYSSFETAQMRKDERERAAKAAQAISIHYYALGDMAEDDADVVAFDERMIGASECATAIRTLTDKEGKKS
ncbi:hypothetical protein AA11826_1687 [Komagataeibacter oboediens DSM 11826]|uniref:Uncharacterized protein n=1 Tax=Komagataeibacter oboediens TaxID=65958 RepID=A0A318QW80_9PROT|nr:hypothetical protein [Komagataeibacter oboediens]PYD81602.1 hypothetical protein CFR80_10710 [Komagataeibacter oboediens]GBR37522.1 hypothetical protein AA11826_1687 [Komagataeibacter oboediens DSM 11826]